MGRNVYRTVLAVAAVMFAAATAGCSPKGDTVASGDTPGPTVSTSAPAPQSWHPCAQLSEALVRKSGFDPATKQSGLAGRHPASWDVCSWHDNAADDDTTYTLAVFFSPTVSLNQVRRKQNPKAVAEVTIDGRKAIQFTRDNGCGVAYTAEHGGLVQLVAIEKSPNRPGATCVVAQNAATVLSPDLPKGTT